MFNMCTISAQRKLSKKLVKRVQQQYITAEQPKRSGAASAKGAL